MDDKYFIKTSDKEMAEYLRQHGYQELQMEGSKWVFLNISDENINFSGYKGNLHFSNMLCI